MINGLLLILLSVICISVLLRFFLNRPLKEIFWDWVNAFFS